MDEYIPVDLDLSGPDGSQVAADGEGQAAATAVVEPEAPVEAQPAAPDWEAENNPYKARYTGIQSEFTRVRTAQQQADQRLAQL